MPASTRIPGRRFLQSPGPAPVPDEVLHAMSRQPMDMGDPLTEVRWRVAGYLVTSS